MSKLKILTLVEATTVNAVARNVLDFQSSARELRETDPGFPTIEVSIATFDREANGAVARPRGPQPGSPAGVGR